MIYKHKVLLTKGLTVFYSSKKKKNLFLAFDMMTTCRTCSDEAIFVPLYNDGMVVFRVTALSHFLVIYPHSIAGYVSALKETEQGWSEED